MRFDLDPVIGMTHVEGRGALEARDNAPVGYYASYRRPSKDVRGVCISRNLHPDSSPEINLTWPEVIQLKTALGMMWDAEKVRRATE